MGFPTFLNLSLNLAIRNHNLNHNQIMVLCLLTVENFSIFGCKEYNQFDLSIDYLVMSMCIVISCFVRRGCLLEEGEFSWQNSISLCPASFCTPWPNLPVTPGIFWLPTFAFQSPIMKRTSFFYKGKGEGQITWGFYHCEEFRYYSLWLKPLRAFGQAVTISNMYFKVVILAAMWRMIFRDQVWKQVDH